MSNEQRRFHVLPPGMTVKPLYDKCPRCGCDLQEFYEAEQEDACNSNRISYEFFEHLNQLVPGSVVIDREARQVTLKGWDLEELVRSPRDEYCTKNIKKYAESFGGSPAESEDPFPETIFLLNGRFKRVIYPFSNADKNAAKCGQAGCSCRVIGEHSRPSQNKHESTQRDKDFIPGIKGKLREWVVHIRKFLFQPIGRG